LIHLICCCLSFIIDCVYINKDTNLIKSFFCKILNCISASYLPNCRQTKSNYNKVKLKQNHYFLLLLLYTQLIIIHILRLMPTLSKYKYYAKQKSPNYLITISFSKIFLVIKGLGLTILHKRNFKKYI
jgi:hypothetical protein